MSRFSALNYESDTCIPLLHFSFFYPKNQILYCMFCSKRQLERAMSAAPLPSSMYGTSQKILEQVDVLFFCSQPQIIYLYLCRASVSFQPHSITFPKVYLSKTSFVKAHVRCASVFLCLQLKCRMWSPSASSAFNHRSNYYISLLHIYLSEISKQSKPPHWFCFKMATYTHQASTTLLSSSIYSLKDKQTNPYLVLLDLEIHKFHHPVLCLLLSISALSLLFKMQRPKPRCGTSSVSPLGSKVQLDVGFDLCLFCSKVGPHQLHVCCAPSSLCSPKDLRCAPINILLKNIS